MYKTTTQEQKSRHMEESMRRLRALRLIMGRFYSDLTDGDEQNPAEVMERFAKYQERSGKLSSRGVNEKIFEHLSPEEIKIVSDGVQGVATGETGTH